MSSMKACDLYKVYPEGTRFVHNGNTYEVRDNPDTPGWHVWNVNSGWSVMDQSIVGQTLIDLDTLEVPSTSEATVTQPLRAGEKPNVGDEVTVTITGTVARVYSNNFAVDLLDSLDGMDYVWELDIPFDHEQVAIEVKVYDPLDDEKVGFITWRAQPNPEQDYVSRFARRYGHPDNGVWQLDTAKRVETRQLRQIIGGSEVNVLTIVPKR